MPTIVRTGRHAEAISDGMDDVQGPIALAGLARDRRHGLPEGVTRQRLVGLMEFLTRSRRALEPQGQQPMARGLSNADTLASHGLVRPAHPSLTTSHHHPLTMSA